MSEGKEMTIRLSYDICYKCDKVKYVSPDNNDTCPKCLGWKRKKINGKYVYVLRKTDV